MDNHEISAKTRDIFRDAKNSSVYGRAWETSGKVPLLDSFYGEGDHLLLYESCEEKYPTFTIFTECGLKYNELCCYIYPTESERLKFDYYFRRHAGRIRLFPITDGRKTVTDGDINRIFDIVNQMSDSAETYPALRLQIDFGSILNNSTLEAILNLENWVHKRNCPKISSMSAFNLQHLDEDIVDELIKNHEKVTTATKKETKISFSQPDGELNIYVISRDGEKQSIKKAVDILVLALLQGGPMYGPDIIRGMKKNFGVHINWGDIYPLIDSLEKQSYLKGVKMAEDNKRLYSLTKEGGRFVGGRIKEFVGSIN